MKKSKILLFLLLGMFVVFQSCEKKTLSDTENGVEKDEIISADEIKIPKIITVLTDTEETDYNLTLLKYGEYLDKIIKEKPLSKQFLSNIIKRGKDEILLSEFMKKNNISTNFIWQLEYQGVEYNPIIYIPNIKVAKFNYNPIIALGCEIEETGREDIIPGWYYNESGKKIFVKIDEEFARKSKRIILIVNGISTQYTGRNNIKDENVISNKDVKTNPITKIDEYSIDYRYDKSKNSEYSYKIVYEFVGGGMRESGYRTEIKEINKKDIGHTFTNDFEIWQFKSLTDLHGAYFVTFEYDWWATKKIVDWGYITCKCARMKFNHEWYQKFYFLVDSGTTVTNNSKGHIKIKM